MSPPCAGYPRPLSPSADQAAGWELGGSEGCSALLSIRQPHPPSPLPALVTCIAAPSQHMGSMTSDQEQD